MDFEILQKAPVFRGFKSDDINSLLSLTRYRVKKFRAGSLIAQSGEPVNSLMIIISGVVKGEMVDYAGKVIKIEDIPAPGALASAFLFGNKNVFPVNIIAISDTELVVIEKSDFLPLLMADDRILVNFLDMISNRSQFLSEKIKFLNFRTIRGKLAQYILNLQGRGENTVRLDRTQNDLADFFGVARPSIARAIGEMEAQGIIKADGKNVTIIKKEKLTELISD